MSRRRGVGGGGSGCDMGTWMWVIVSMVCLYILSKVDQAEATYKIGVGRADCTGPSVEVIFVSIFIY